MAKNNTNLQQLMDELAEEELNNELSADLSPSLNSPLPPARAKTNLNHLSLSVDEPPQPSSKKTSPTPKNKQTKGGAKKLKAQAGEKQEAKSLIKFEPHKRRAAKENKSKEEVKKSVQSNMEGWTPAGLPAESLNRPGGHGGINFSQSESLRAAQEKISALDEEIDRLRRENENFIAAADIFEKKADEGQIKYDDLKKDYEESREQYDKEKKTLEDALTALKREMEKLKNHNKNLEDRLSQNVQQIRRRERDLENQLEMMKLDDHFIRQKKDQNILSLKREIDKIKIERSRHKNKYNEAQKNLESFRDQARKAKQSLHVALNILKWGAAAGGLNAELHSSLPADNGPNKEAGAPSPGEAAGDANKAAHESSNESQNDPQE